MMRERAINLGPKRPSLPTDEAMLITLYREPSTSQLLVRVTLAEFQFILATNTASKSDGIQLARRFIERVGYVGKLLWQTSATGPITAEPVLATC